MDRMHPLRFTQSNLVSKKMICSSALPRSTFLGNAALEIGNTGPSSTRVISTTNRPVTKAFGMYLWKMKDTEKKLAETQNGKNFKVDGDYPIYVASERRESTNSLDVTNKFTGAAEGKVGLASAQDIEDAIQGAVKATAAMAALPSYERKAILEKVVTVMRERAEEIAHVITFESGKPIKDARGEVQRSLDTFQIAAEEATRMYGEHLPLDISPRNKGLQGITRKFPIGPISMVSPWNFPLNLVAHKVAPAIAAGCTFVLKPSSRTPMSALILGEILSQCENLPKGAFSVLPCSRKDADAFTTDERLKLLTFTGSGTAGWDMKARAGKKKVVMELGGNAPCIVEDLVPDLDGTVARLVHGGFYQSGQSCIHMQRLYVKHDHYHKVRRALVEAVKKLKVGNPFEDDTAIGPMISESAATQVEQMVKDAEKQGGKILIGGKRKGAIMEPTIMENVPLTAEARREEIFGPVILLESYRDFKEAIAMANDTHYGLQAGVFTSNLNKAFYAFENLQVGGVCLNDSPSMRVDSQPYGGVKDSGIQREGVRYAMDDMLETKVLVMRDLGVLQ